MLGIPKTFTHELSAHTVWLDGDRVRNLEGDYGYFPPFGAWVCYTDGAYCDCGEDDE